MKINALLPLSQSSKLIKFAFYIMLSIPVIISGPYKIDILIDSWIKALLLLFYFLFIGFMIYNYEFIFSKKTIIDFRKDGAISLLDAKHNYFLLNQKDANIIFSKKERKIVLFFPNENKRFILYEKWWFYKLNSAGFKNIIKYIFLIKESINYKDINIKECMYV